MCFLRVFRTNFPEPKKAKNLNALSLAPQPSPIASIIAPAMQPKVTRSRVKPKMFELDKDSALAKSSCCKPTSNFIFRTALALFIILLVALAVVFFDRIQYACVAFLELVSRLGFWGMILLGIANVLGSIFLLPSLIFTLAAGFLYGVFAGTILISVSCTLSMMTSFLIARYMARSTVERQFGSMPRFQLIDRAIRDEGFVLVLLIRCSPVHPFAILNYLLGVTSISFADYSIASFIGMFPSTIMEVFFGSGLKSVADLLVGHVSKQDEQFSRFYFWMGMMITVISTVWVTIWVKRKLDVKLQAYQPVDRDADERIDLIDSHATSMSVVAPSSPHPTIPPASSSNCSSPHTVLASAFNAVGDSVNSHTLSTPSASLQMSHLHFNEAPTSPELKASTLEASLAEEDARAGMLLSSIACSTESAVPHSIALSLTEAVVPTPVNSVTTAAAHE